MKQQYVSPECGIHWNEPEDVLTMSLEDDNVKSYALWTEGEWID